MKPKPLKILGIGLIVKIIPEADYPIGFIHSKGLLDLSEKEAERLQIWLKQALAYLSKRKK